MEMENMDNVSFLDLLAFNEARKDAQVKDERIPCWMVSSDEAKAKMRQIALDRLSAAHGLPLTEQGASRLMQGAKATMQPMMEEWIQWEMEMQLARKNGNIQAWFV